MNLQAAYEAPGQWITMKGIPTEYKYNSQGQYGPYANGKLRDQQGAVVDILFGVKKGMVLPENLLNIECIWGVRYDAHKQQYKALFNQYASKGAAPQQIAAPMPSQNAPAPSQSAPQPHQNAPQQAIPPGRSRDATGVSIERQAVVKAVLGSHQCPADPGMIIKWCCILHKWVETGQDIPVQAEPYCVQDDQGPPINDEDIPF